MPRSFGRVWRVGRAIDLEPSFASHRTGGGRKAMLGSALGAHCPLVAPSAYSIPSLDWFSKDTASISPASSDETGGIIPQST